MNQNEQQQEIPVTPTNLNPSGLTGDDENIDFSYIDENLAEIEDKLKAEQRKAEAKNFKENLKIEIIEKEKLIPKEVFCQMMAMGEAGMQRITGLNTLKFDDETTKQAIEAYGAMYELMADCEQFRWLLNPSSKKMMNIATVGLFFIPLGFACGREIKQKRANGGKQGKPVNGGLPKPEEQEKQGTETKSYWQQMAMENEQAIKEANAR